MEQGELFKKFVKKKTPFTRRLRDKSVELKKPVSRYLKQIGERRVVNVKPNVSRYLLKKRMNVRIGGEK